MNRIDGSTGVGIYEWPPRKSNASPIGGNNPKRAFAEHLASIGFELETPPDVIMKKLRQRMGEARFKEIFGDGSGGHSAQAHEQFYAKFTDLVEGNLMRSLDPGATLESSFQLYQCSARQLRPGAKVIELGCWTGGLASFIAKQHPQCAVVGVDLGRHIVEACTEFYNLPNLTFVHWNYRWGKPQELEPADVLLCSLGVVHQLPDNTELPDPSAVRRSREYRIQFEHAAGYFGIWRTAAKDDALLYAVLRLRLFPRFLAWVDAAQASGWTPMLDRLWHVEIPSENTPLPGLVFQARPCERLAEQTVLDRWTWYACRSHVYAHLTGGPALAAFRKLHARSPLAVRKYRRNGVLTNDEVGVNEEVGYVFTHDASAEYRLLIVSHSRARELAAGISTPNSCTPIQDDAVFENRTVPAGAAGAAPRPSRSQSPFFSGPPSALAG